jgi:hypothetical protein
MKYIMNAQSTTWPWSFSIDNIPYWIYTSYNAVAGLIARKFSKPEFKFSSYSM